MMSSDVSECEKTARDPIDAIDLEMREQAGKVQRRAMASLGVQLGLAMSAGMKRKDSTPGKPN